MKLPLFLLTARRRRYIRSYQGRNCLLSSFSGRVARRRHYYVVTDREAARLIAEWSTTHRRRYIVTH